MMHISKRDAPIAGGSNSSSAGAPEILMAPLTTTNMDLIARVFKEFRKNACVRGDDRISESFIKAGRQLLGAFPGDGPIEMVLYCPKCHVQHIDAPESEPGRLISGGPNAGRAVPPRVTWANPPHRSHLCHACGHIWRPADVETTGVVSITTKGKADTPANAATANVLTDEQQRTIEHASTKLENIGHIFAGDKESRRLAAELRALLCGARNSI